MDAMLAYPDDFFCSDGRNSHKTTSSEEYVTLTSYQFGKGPCQEYPEFNWNTSPGLPESASFNNIEYKPVPFNSADSDDSGLDSWQKRPPSDWSTDDVLNLIYYGAQSCQLINFANLRGEQFQNLTAADLFQMTAQQFKEKDPENGILLYEVVQQLLHENGIKKQDVKVKSVEVKEEITDWECSGWTNGFPGDVTLPTPVLDMLANDEFTIQDAVDLQALGPEDLTFDDDFDTLYLEDKLLMTYLNDSIFQNRGNHREDSSFSPTTNFYDDHFQFPINPRTGSSSSLPNMHDSTTETSFHHDATCPVTTKPGRRRRTCSNVENINHEHQNNKFPANKGGHLWEFLRHMLRAGETDSTCDSLIQWENRDDGIFRIMDSKAVAKLWGEYKGNGKMTYEKLSRALRWCRTYGFLSALPRDGKYPKKLCFRFGARAVNWRY